MSPGDQRADDIIEFSEANEAPKKRRGGFVIALMLALLLFGGTGAAIWTVDDWWPVGDDMEIPLVKANTGPIKVRPEDPGGMTVPNQDKLVYDKLGNPSVASGVERLLPAPETPMPRPARTPRAAQQMPNLEATPAPSAAPPARPPAPPAPPSNRTPTPAEVAAVKPPAAAPKPPLPAPPVSAKTVPTKGSGKYVVQLLAVRALADAQREWERLKRRNPELLSKLDRSITKADLGAAKGIFYRLRAGPLESEEVARKLCAELAKRKVGCLIVRPGS